MIATTVAVSAVAVTGGVVAGCRSMRSRNVTARRRFSREEILSATELGFATCRFDESGATELGFARRERRLHLSLLADVLIFRESGDPSADLTELLPLRRMQVSSNGNTIDIEVGSHKVSLQLDEGLEADNFLRELETAKRFLDNAFERMATVRETLGAFNAMLRDRVPLSDTLVTEKNEVPFFHARSTMPHVANTTEPPKAIQMDDAESDDEIGDKHMRRSSLEKWERMDWSIHTLASSLGLAPLVKPPASLSEALSPARTPSQTPRRQRPGTDQTDAPAEQIDASRCIILFPMFNEESVDLVSNPTFFNDVRGNVQRECANFGPVLRVWINPNSQGDVWVHFEDLNHAVRCQRALDKKWFGGQIINVEFASEENWNRNVGKS